MFLFSVALAKVEGIAELVDVADVRRVLNCTWTQGLDLETASCTGMPHSIIRRAANRPVRPEPPLQ
jgi:hypothetical protein